MKYIKREWDDKPQVNKVVCAKDNIGLGISSKIHKELIKLKNWTKDLNRNLTKAICKIVHITSLEKANWSNRTGYHHICISRVKTRKTHSTKYTRMYSNRNAHHCQWKCNVVQLLWKRVWQFHMKPNIILSRNRAVKILGI